MSDTISKYLEGVRKQFLYYKKLGEGTFSQLSDEQLFWQYNPECNSISIIVNHLWGNMMSRWTDFLSSDGEKEWRNRDLEFESVIHDRTEMMQKWKEGWEALFFALDSIREDNFTNVVYIRNQAHSIPDALSRQMMHYASHIGQIIYIGKMCKGMEWQTLSIARGQSKEFNQHKFSKGKHKGHFTDEI